MRLGPEHCAVVIGGGGGVGRGIALGLAARGVRCVIADIEIDTAEAVADELAVLGVDALAISVDATSTESLTALADEVEARFGAIHVLSNNVGPPRAADDHGGGEPGARRSHEGIFDGRMGRLRRAA